MKYAENTNVSSEISRLEIEKTLIRYGAEQFAYGTLPGKAIIAFAMQNRQVKIILPLPKKEDFRYTPGRRIERTEKSQYDAWEQACRQRWRALHLVIKAKLEAIETESPLSIRNFFSTLFFRMVEPQVIFFFRRSRPPTKVERCRPCCRCWGDKKATPAESRSRTLIKKFSFIINEGRNRIHYLNFIGGVPLQVKPKDKTILRFPMRIVRVIIKNITSLSCWKANKKYSRFVLQIIQTTNKGVKFMYVNPFWLGVLVTVVVELVSMIVYAGLKGAKK